MKVIDIVDKTSAVVKEVPKPSVNKPNDVLIKVSFGALDTAFPEIAERTFVGSILRDVKAKPLVPGWHYSGVVENVGSGVSDLKEGDNVFGHLQYVPSNKQGSCAEYILVPRDDCARAPTGVDLDVAAAASVEALSALQAMRDHGGFSREKSNILVIAAGGGVGTQAIQIAKNGLNATIVHGVCSTKDVDTVRKLGADRVFDRSKMDITKDLQPESYDVILELTGKYSFGSLKYALKPKGTIVTTVPNITTMFFAWLVPLLNLGKKYRSFIVQSRRSDLELIANWLESEKIQSVPIDSITNVHEFYKAWERLGNPKKNGRVVIKVASGW
jgi:NADPH:quinone reductase-like Zn-dependent oxidoreductase